MVSAADHNRDNYSDGKSDKYEEGAPHLKHKSIGEMYDKIIESAAADCSGKLILDLGAGDGQITKRFCHAGAQVTAVDISADQLAKLMEKCSGSSGKIAIHCGDAVEFVDQTSVKWDVIVINSFLHHVPDYSRLLVGAAMRLNEGGRLITFQDPMRYDLLSYAARGYSAFAYFCWRIVQREVFGGMLRRTRRLFGRYDSDSMHDNAEYHVVRNGVDHQLLAKKLSEVGLKVQLTTYFSTQASWCQRLGEAFGFVNHFAIVAERHRKIP